MKRIVFLDYIRVFACFLVMLVHASENYYAGPGSTDMVGPVSFLLNETDRFWVSLYDGFSRMSVPLFMIVSAYLLAPMKEGETMWGFYRNRAWRILPPFICFVLLYCLLPVAWGQLTIDAALTDLSRVWLNFPSLAGHLWFVYPLLSLYLFIPVISPWLRKATAKEERFFIALFLISTCMPYLRRFFGEVWGECFWNEYHLLWYFSGYLGYLVAAHYIRVHLTWNSAKRLAIGGASMLVGAVATIYSFYIQAIPGQLHNTPTIELGWAFCTINCAALTLGAFLMFSTIPASASNKQVTEISKLSYGMYLMHIFWLGFWVSIFKAELALYTGVAIPVIALCTFICCYITTKLISYIPGAVYLVGAGKGFKS